MPQPIIYNSSIKSRSKRKVPRSAYSKVNGLVYFGRMIDKVRLTDAGVIQGYNLGTEDWYFFDSRCCRFLGITYASFVRRVGQGGTAKEILAWCWKKGTKRSPEEVSIWNTFMCKRGWNDEASGGLMQAKRQAGFADESSIRTWFDLFDREEGRKARH